MHFVLGLILVISLMGCASTVVYDPMQRAIDQRLLLNQGSFKAIQEGQTMDKVHEIMGDKLVIGYGLQVQDYKPLTIPNPYKTEVLKGTEYIIEYYIEAIRQPDGLISDNELMPLIFKNGKLIGRGWPLANSLRR
jgi:hypothetical protein